MAASIYGTIRLDADLTGNLPTNTYTLFRGYRDLRRPAVVAERSLTGLLHVHRLLDGGNPEVFIDRQYPLWLTSAEKATLEADLGKTVYFMPNERDEGAGYASYRFVVLFEALTNVRPSNNARTHWYANITLRDDPNGSV